ncbi:hypothetical protein BRC86_12415 [Halobacteriales archaeon QS_3_64_16]|nr:MAG: hypothetical protein BRC86_12415 [Halobacteriales archaeon QS_3_64_16]
MSKSVVLTSVQENYPNIADIVKNTTTIEIDFNNDIIRDGFKRAEFESIDAFYEEKTNEDPIYFAKALTTDWIPAIERDSFRAIHEKPHNSYLIHSVRTAEEIAFIKESIGDDIVIISESSTHNEIANLSDVVVKFDRKKLEQK